MAETEQLGQAREQGAAGQPYSILLVEDDNVTLKAVEAILRIHGHYRVTTAMSVAQALQHVNDARGKGQLFDMILTDLCLPEVSGLQLIQEITDIPVVVMSCQDSQASVLQCFEAGAAGYLIKPIRKNEVSTLWQHIWRNNRCKVTSHVAAAAAAAAPGNDSGMSACTDMVGQQSSEPFPSTMPMAEATTPGSAQPSAPEEAAMPSEAPSSASKPSGPPGLALHVQPLPGAGIAAIHVDLPISGVSTVAASVRTLASSQLDAGVGAAPALLTVGAQACAAEPSSGDDVPPCSTSSPVVVAEGSNDPSGCSSGGGSEVTFALASSSQYNVRAPQPLSRPMATSTGASQPGRIRHLPPGLQELAALGQQRQQQEAGPNAAAAQQPQQHVTDETAPEHGGLNHSFGSAFTAVTVFLPRSAAAMPGPAGQGADAGSAAAALQAEPGSNEQGAAQQQQAAGQDATESATASREPSARSEPSSTQPTAAIAGGGLTVAGLAAATSSAVASGAAEAKAAASAPQPSAVTAPAASLLPGNTPSLWASTLPALQPLMACHMPATAHGQAAAMGQVHYLPQSVLQLICALSTPGGAGVMGAPGAPGVLSSHNRVPGAPSADGAQSKATHRQQAVAKYLEKRKMRTFEKKVRYESRKRLAESRPRVKGQFVKSSVLAAAKAAEAAEAHADAAGQRHAAAKGSSESDAAEVLAGLADVPVGAKRCRSEPAHEVESEDDAMSDTEP